MDVARIDEDLSHRAGLNCAATHPLFAATAHARLPRSLRRAQTKVSFDDERSRMKVRTMMVVTLLVATSVVSGARAQQSPAQPAGEPVKLSELLAEAERNNPALKAAAQTVDARRARIPQARAWPDPQLPIGYVGDFAPFKTRANDPASYRQFGVMQEIPYPGKGDLRGKIADKDVEAEK